MHKPTNWAGMLPRTPRQRPEAPTTTGTPATPSTSNAGGGFDALAARTYRARQEMAHGAFVGTTEPSAPIATGADQGQALANLAARTYQRRAADRAAFREKAADDAFRLATERAPDGGGGPWGQG